MLKTSTPIFELEKFKYILPYLKLKWVVKKGIEWIRKWVVALVSNAYGNGYRFSKSMPISIPDLPE